MIEDNEYEYDDDDYFREICSNDPHRSHCKHCYNVRTCESKNECPLVYCENKCGQIYHACKSSEHLSETCANSFVDCINKTNGCKLKIKRALLGMHLTNCVASVIRCSSFTLRKVFNKSKTVKFKWPDPVTVEKEELEKSYICKLTDRSLHLSEILLENDYEALKEFSAKNPLLFQRMYGYLIGLKLESFSRKNNKFGFLRYLLKNVKSKILKDIEAENCIVFNDYEGCAACQTRVRNMEMTRFSKLKHDYYNFGILLKHCYSYADFIETKTYENPEFLKVYHQLYPIPDDSLLDEEEDMAVAASVNQAELQEKLIQNNQELLEFMSLDTTLKLNVAKELACDAFQMSYESYRLVDTTFAVDCEKFFRRDEYSQHYSLVHNFLMPYIDSIYSKCPFYEYGCRFYEKKYDFLYVKREDAKHCSSRHQLSANLNYNTNSKCLGFSFNNMVNIKKEDDNENSEINLLDLPYDVLFEIFDHFDSMTLFNLSLTSKASRDICKNFLQFRGIIYPKWRRRDVYPTDYNIATANKAGNKRVICKKYWSIDKYVYSFSKHFKSPKCIRVKTELESGIGQNLNEHIQKCMFRKTKEMPAKFKIYPPFD